MNHTSQVICNILESTGSFRLVFLGDSLTSTEWVHPNWREIIEYVLKEEFGNELNDWKLASWGLRCFNAGFDGSTTADWLKLLEHEVISLEPDMVMMMGSSNDAWFGLDPSGSRANLATIINRLRRARVGQIVYSTSHAFGGDREPEKYAPFATAARQLMSRLEDTPGIQFVDMQKAFANYKLQRFYTFQETHNDPVTHVTAGDTDTTHPNRLGQAYLAKIFLKEVFDIEFDPQMYLDGLLGNHKFPTYK